MAAQDAAQRVLDAAAELFAERGYAAATTRAVAERARVNEVTVFRRFGSKAGLLAALGARIADTTAAFRLETAPHPEDLHATLTALARAEIDGGLQHGGLALRLAVDARSVPEVAELLGTGTSGNLAGLTRYFAERQAAGDLRDDVPAELLAESFFALTSSLVMGRSLRGAPLPDGSERHRLVDQLVDLFREGAARRDVRQ